MKLPELPWEKLEKLQRPHKYGIFFGTIILLVAAFWFLVYNPMLMRISDLEAEMETKQRARNQKVAETKGLPSQKQTLAELRLEYEFTKQFLPEEEEVPSLLQQISTLANDAALKVSLFQPRSDVVKTFYAEVPFDINLRGPYLNIAQFLYELGRMKRIVNVTSLYLTNSRAYNSGKLNLSIGADGQISGGSGNLVIVDEQTGRLTFTEELLVLDATCTGITYRSLSEAEMKALEEERKEKKKKKK